MQNQNSGMETDTSKGSVREQIVGKKDELTEKAGDVKDRVANAGRKASDKIDAQREPAAKRLEKAAQTLRERGNSGTSMTARAAKSTADTIQSTADYIRENDLRAMMEDVQDVVREHPVPAIAAAVVAGFLIGKAFSGGRD